MMMQRPFQDISLPLLGFGTMRLPLSGAAIDEAATSAMVRYAYEHGVRYFDTAYPYHGGESERVIGRVLSQFPRDSYYLATKYPGHQISQTYDPAAIFEEQLQKCGVDYFDFYLLHNVYENSLPTYRDARWGIIDYFLAQKRNGRIRHLGFSAHGGVDNLREFLDAYGDVMEFGQLQINYLDWTLQEAEAKYNLMTERNIPVWVMEPVRGGRLASLSEADTQKLKTLRPNESTAAWTFRWLQTLPNVTMILSGMSTMAQVVDNVRTFTTEAPLTQPEADLLLAIAEGMKDSVPCTACRYCCAECPQGLDIPTLLNLYNQARFSPAINVGMRVEALPETARPSACIACGACSRMCPQNIDIPAALEAFTGILATLPSWAEICRQRDEAARPSKEET